LSRDPGIVTPPELVRSIYGSRLLGALFAAVMIVFTIPYLALQPMAGGYALEALVGLPYFYGCTLVTGIIVVYTLRGGIRAVVMDFWARGRIGPPACGLPTWMGYFVLLSIGQTVLTYRRVRGGRSR
jgi:Na+/proline symporter